ncbi:MAG: hypothetical protein ACPGJS_13680 [Flammeovirgaceae bacterium]
MKKNLTLAIILITVMSLPLYGENEMIPKGKHIVWHDGGDEYFAIFENGMLYSLHLEDNSYQKIHKVKNKALIAELFSLAESKDFLDLHPPLNRDAVLEADEDYKHIELRKEGRKYEVYWSEKDDADEPDFLTKLLEQLMALV